MNYQKILDTTVSFARKVMNATAAVVIGTIKDITRNWEAVTILSFAGIGVTKVLVEIPFHIMIPLWLEGWLASSMILPVLSTVVILMLLQIWWWRNHEAEVVTPS